jgi:type I restriction enzyme S subunit
MKPGYKQTEVGVIPEDWEVKPLTIIADRIMVGIASAATHAYRDKGVPMFRNQNIKPGHLDDSDLLFISPEYEATFKNKRLRKGDLLTMRTGYPGVTAIVPAHYESAQSFTTLITRPKEEEAKSTYLCHYINSELGQHFFTQSQIGGAQKNVNVGTLRKMLIPLPKPPEQRAIAEALSDVDGLLGGLDRLIAKKHDLKQAAMQQLLTGQTRLPGFHGEWEVKAIHELSQVGRGRVISHTEILKAASPNYPVFSSQTSDSGIMGYLDTYDFQGDYVTWTTDGANAGTVFARSGRFNCTNVCGTIKLHDSDHRFIAAALGRVSKSHVSRHLGNPKLMNDVMKKIQITIPNTRPEQTAIAQILSDMDAELTALEQRREKVRALKQSMMQELLTGRTRLV